MEIVLSAFIGLGLAAATGFRVFVPFLVLSVASRAGYVELSGGFEWIGSQAALVAFALATVLEIGAYYVPWLDNLLDTLTTPTAVVAGVVLTAAATGDLSPLLQWSLAILAGGGVASVFQGFTAGSRVLSSVVTGGLGNVAIATLEAVLSLVLAVLAVLVPVAAFALLVVLLYLALQRIVLGRGQGRETARGA